MGIGMEGEGIDLHCALVPNITSPVKRRITVDSFPVSFRARNTDAIIVSGNRREVKNADQVLVFPPPEVGNNAVLDILAIDPGKPLGRMVPFPKRRLLPVKPGEILEKSLKTLTPRVGMQIPF